MKYKLLFLICFLAVSSFAADSAKQSILQFRLVVEKPTADSEKALLYETMSNGKKAVVEFQVLKTLLLDGSSVKAAVVSTESGRVDILITLTDEGKTLFAKITREHIDQRLAIFIDGKLYEVPVIKMEIPSGTMQITGSFSKQEAEELAKKINDAVAK